MFHPLKMQENPGENFPTFSRRKFSAIFRNFPKFRNFTKFTEKFPKFIGSGYEYNRYAQVKNNFSPVAACSVLSIS